MANSFHPHLPGADSSQQREPAFLSLPTWALGAPVEQMETRALSPVCHQVEEARQGSWDMGEILLPTLLVHVTGKCHYSSPWPSTLGGQIQLGLSRFLGFLLQKPAAHGSQGRTGRRQQLGTLMLCRALSFSQCQQLPAMDWVGVGGVCDASFQTRWGFQLRLRADCCHILYCSASSFEVATHKHSRYEDWQ